VVGLTGTVGAGKSTVGRLFERWGARRVDADELARKAVRPGSEALERIRAEWGTEVIAADGTLDRAALRERIFGDPEARRRLEAILHPEIRRLRAERLRRAREEGVEVVVAEIPLLFETGMEEEFDLVVAVDADRAIRRRRVAGRGVDGETFEAIEAAQWEGAEKRAAADLVIRNDADRSALEERAREVWRAIRSRAAAGTG